jgi:hypothetical protein
MILLWQDTQDLDPVVGIWLANGCADITRCVRHLGFMSPSLGHRAGGRSVAIM